MPEHLTEQITPSRAAMLGTNQPKPRCIALDGEVGQHSFCTIHARRPTPCRDFEASFEQGQPNSRCDDARARYGLPPLTSEDWEPIAPEPTPPVPAPGDDDKQAS